MANNPVAQEIGHRLATKDLLHEISALAQQAAVAIMKVYALPFDVTHKDDKSPVTAADHAAEAIILKGLKGLTPDIAVIAEEEMAAGREPDTKAGVFWLVDPLDGTKEFVKKNGEFTVNIALVADGRTVLGVVLAPATQSLWRGLNWGEMPYAELLQGQAEARRIATRAPSADGITVFASRTHGSYRDPELEDFLTQFRIAERKQAGSSLKFCRIAAGEADLYPRFGPTMEWDTAAGQAVLEAAGGRVTTMDGAPVTYGKPSFRNPHFVAWGWKDGELERRGLEKVKPSPQANE
ncbi:MAG: 3'(2'),5'-bisphosphate nucleotidase CysQ [Rhodospirillales bacterium]